MSTSRYFLPAQHLLVWTTTTDKISATAGMPDHGEESWKFPKSNTKLCQGLPFVGSPDQVKYKANVFSGTLTPKTNLIYLGI